MLLPDKVALIIGGKQTLRETIGDSWAVAIEFARQGAKVTVADLNLGSAQLMAD